MAIELKVPSVGESITEVQIGEWLVPEGKSARADEVLVVIETDKVTVELPAPTSGRVLKVLKKQGEPAEVGEVIGTFEEGAVDDDAGSLSSKGASAPKGEPVAPMATPSSAPATSGTETVTMPSARRVLAEAGVDATGVTGTGKDGRILKEDALRHVAMAPAVASTQEELVPMSPLRARIATRLVEAQQQAALLTTFNEIDMAPVKALRKQYQDRFVAKHGVKLGFMSFFVKAAVEALQEVPGVNAIIEGKAVRYRNYQDIGIAVGGGKGLVVPIIRGAERLSFADVEKSIADFGQRAQKGQLTLDELQGGTFTISNGGIYGSLLSTPIVNPPQSGILGLHAIQDRPVAVNGQVVIRPMMYVALTYDHRLVDGREAVTFLKRIKECLEEPARILLEI